MKTLNTKTVLVLLLVLCVFGAITYRIYSNAKHVREVHIENGSGFATILLDGIPVARVVSHSVNRYSVEVAGMGTEVVTVNFEKGASFPEKVNRVVEENGTAYVVGYNDRGDVVSRVSLAMPFPKSREQR